MDGGWADQALDDLWVEVEPALPAGIMVNRAKARSNVAAVVAYGESEGAHEWGGVYVNWEGPVATVACFTGGLERHGPGLQRAVPSPELLVVRQVGRSEADLAVALGQVEELLSRTPSPWTPSPWTAAVRWADDGFVVRVRLLREQVAIAARLEQRFGDLVRVEPCL